MRNGFLLLALCAQLLPGQTTNAPAPTAAQVFDRQIKGPESELVSLIEAMPESAFAFKPKEGAFEKSRTFAQQAKHIAYVNYVVAAGLLQEQNPSSSGKDENGPDTITSKEQIVKFVKDSFAYCHKAMATLTAANLMELIPDAFDSTHKSTRVNTAGIIAWHTFDHYGQMVIYARMNNVVPPASR